MNYLNSVKRSDTILECVNVNVWTLNHSKNIKALNNNNNHIKTLEERAFKAEMRRKKWFYVTAENGENGQSNSIDTNKIDITNSWNYFTGGSCTFKWRAMT